MASDQKYPLASPPVFVCGVQRSGTTLLVKMLSKNREIQFLPQETHLYPLLWRPGNKLNQFINSADLADHLLEKLPAVNYGWTTAMPFLQSITDEIRTHSALPENVAELLHIFLLHWQEQQDKTVITGEKTPAHIYYAQKTMKEFPACRMILMCRDPRAAALSEHIKLKNNPRVSRKFNAFNFIVRWSTANALIHELKQRSNIYFLKYEDLICHPEASIKSVADFLGIEYSVDMLDVGVTNSSFGDKNQKNVSFNKDNLDRWKTELPGSTVALIEKHLHPQMNALGYALTTDLKISVPFSQKLKFRVANQLSKQFPARFHHLNRNKKYRD